MTIFFWRYAQTVNLLLAVNAGNKYNMLTNGNLNNERERLKVQLLVKYERFGAPCMELGGRFCKFSRSFHGRRALPPLLTWTMHSLKSEYIFVPELFIPLAIN